jgi:hypothetical protein
MKRIIIPLLAVTLTSAQVLHAEDDGQVIKTQTDRYGQPQPERTSDHTRYCFEQPALRVCADRDSAPGNPDWLMGTPDLEKHYFRL